MSSVEAKLPSGHKSRAHLHGAELTSEICGFHKQGSAFLQGSYNKALFSFGKYTDVYKRDPYLTPIQLPKDTGPLSTSV